jgi:hypothetical protein
LLFGQGVGVNTGFKEHRLEKKNAPKSLSPDNLPFFENHFIMVRRSNTLARPLSGSGMNSPAVCFIFIVSSISRPQKECGFIFLYRLK